MRFLSKILFAVLTFTVKRFKPLNFILIQKNRVVSG